MEYIYGALLLHKLGKPVDEEHLKKVISSSGAHVDEAKIKTLVASLSGVNIESELANASALSTVSAASAPAEKKEEKKAEAPAESAAGLSALFG